MGATGKIRESFSNKGVRLGYISFIVVLLISITLPLFGRRDWNYIALCAGLSSVGILWCTIYNQCKVLRTIKAGKLTPREDKIIGVVTLLLFLGLMLVFANIFSRIVPLGVN